MTRNLSPSATPLPYAVPAVSSLHPPPSYGYRDGRVVHDYLEG